jgi:hypothetical protein
MGRERPVNNVFKVLSDEYWDPDPFINRLVKPEIKRYENLEDLCPNDYKSIAKLVKKLKLIATMEYKGTKRSDWKWMK